MSANNTNATLPKPQPKPQPKPSYAKVVKNGPNQQKRGRRGGGKYAAKSNQNLNKAVANFTAQMSAGFVPTEPGANKNKDEVCNEKAKSAELSYIDAEPCPDPKCQSKECKTHVQDQKPLETDPKDSTPPAVPAVVDPLKPPPPPPAPMGVPDSLPWNGELPQGTMFHNGRAFFHRLVQGQVSHWWGIVALILLSLTLTTIHLSWMTNFKTQIDIVAPRNCSNPLVIVGWGKNFTWTNLMDEMPQYPAYLWCRVMSWWEDLELVQETVITHYMLEKPYTEPLVWVNDILSTKIYGDTIFAVALALAALLFLAVNDFVLNHKIFDLRLRRFSFFWIFVLLVLQQYMMERANPVIHANSCPTCSVPIMVKYTLHSLDYAIRMAVANLIIFMIYCVGPNYRIYYVYRLIPYVSAHSNKFDANKRGNEDDAHDPRYAYVDSHMTCPWSWLDHRFVDTPWSPWRRDRLLISIELLIQSCNPNSLSPLIDDKLALERINRSAVNDQNVNIDRNILATQQTNIYENTVRVAVEFRQSLVDAAESLSDYRRLNPP